MKMKTFTGVVMALVLLRVEGREPSNGNCTENSCFTVHTDALDFSAARAACETNQGALVSVRSAAASQVISKLLTGLSGHFWIGLTNAGGACTDPSLNLRGYTWITEGTTTEFSSWKSNEVLCPPRCVSLSRDDGLWTERDCEDTAGVSGYLCEYQYSGKCKLLTSEASVLYQTPFGFSLQNLSEVPNSSNATRLDRSSRHICLEGQWFHAPWSCEVYRGGCEHSCSQINDTHVCTCPPGYKLDSNAVTCAKARDDPCLGANCSYSCSPKGKRYECLCPDGFVLGADGKVCEDVDECEDGRVCPGKNFQCFNTRGGFECRCRSGFWREGDVCVDDDECASGPCDHTCTNTEGSYVCECEAGYKVSPEDRHKCALHCPAWECPVLDCDPNNPHQCDCPRGFILDGRPEGLFCVDIDECEMLYCDQGCVNTMGSYNCTCWEGYHLTGNAKCEPAGTPTTYDGFTPPPTETPPAVSVRARLAIGVCTVLALLLLLCLACLLKRRRKSDCCSLDEGCDHDVHDLQQVSSDTYAKKLSTTNKYLNQNIQNL